MEPSFIDDKTLRQLYKVKLYNISYSTQNLKISAFTVNGNRELTVRTGNTDNIYNVNSGDVIDERIILELDITEEEKSYKSVPIVLHVTETNNPSIHVERNIPLSIPLAKN